MSTEDLPQDVKVQQRKLLPVAGALGGGIISAAVLFKLFQKFKAQKGDFESLLGQLQNGSRVNAALRSIEDERQDRVLKDPLAKQIAGADFIYRSQKNIEEVQEFANQLAIQADEVQKLKNSPYSGQYVMDYVSEAAGIKAVQIGMQIQDPDTLLQIKDYQKLGRRLDRHVAREIFIDDLIKCCTGSPEFHPFFNTLRKSIYNTGYFPIKQIVLLNSGMDTRAWRLDLPKGLPKGIKIFEVDTPYNLRIKKQVLKKLNCQLDKNHSPKIIKHPLKCDQWVAVGYNIFHEGWSQELINKGYDIKKPGVFIAESLLQYFDDETIQSFMMEMAQISKSKSVFFGSTVTWEKLEQAKKDGQQKKSIISEFNWGFPNNTNEYFGKLGWETHNNLEQTTAACLYSYGLNLYKGLDPLQVQYLISVKQ